MSVFSKLRLSKKAAKEHKDAKAGKGKGSETTKVPYKHVPSHAAQDALSGAPASWKEIDRPKIENWHKRRSKMAQSQISRSVSMLSTGSNMASVAESIAGASIATTSSRAPPVNLPRNSRNNSYRSSWNDATTMDVRAAPSRVHSYQGHLGGYKGSSYGTTTKMRRGHSYHDSGIGPSPLSSAMHSSDVSPVVSSGNSTNSISSEYLEMHTISKPSHLPTRTSLPRGHTYSSSSISLRTQKPTLVTITSPTAAVVKQGPMPIAEPAPKTKKRFSLLGGRKTSVSA